MLKTGTRDMVVLFIANVVIFVVAYLFSHNLIISLGATTIFNTCVTILFTILTMFNLQDAQRNNDRTRRQLDRW